MALRNPGPTFKKSCRRLRGSASGENACPATWLVSEFREETQDPAHQESFSWPDTRTSASHLGNKNALWATHCSYAAMWERSVHAPDHRENLRNATAICDRCSRDYSAQPPRGKQRQYFNATAITILQWRTCGCPYQWCTYVQSHGRCMRCEPSGFCFQWNTLIYSERTVRRNRCMF